MAGLIAKSLAAQGLQTSRSVEAGLPMTVWVIDLELEVQRRLSAAELTVLRLVDAGVSRTDELTRLMGMGTDTRLAERVLVRLLGALAIEPKGDGFVVSDAGRTWIAAGQTAARERVTLEVRLDPVLDALEWVDYERPLFATADTWTVDVPIAEDDVLRTRKPQLAQLVREQPLPDDLEKPEGERRPAVELRGFSIVSQRVHWRAVRLDTWKDPEREAETVVGHIGEAENPPLTKLLAHYAAVESRKRFVPR